MPCSAKELLQCRATCIVHASEYYTCKYIVYVSATLCVAFFLVWGKWGLALLLSVNGLSCLAASFLESSRKVRLKVWGMGISVPIQFTNNIDELQGAQRVLCCKQVLSWPSSTPCRGKGSLQGCRSWCYPPTCALLSSENLASNFQGTSIMEDYTAQIIPDTVWSSILQGAFSLKLLER